MYLDLSHCRQYCENHARLRRRHALLCTPLVSLRRIGGPVDKPVLFVMIVSTFSKHARGITKASIQRCHDAAIVIITLLAGA